MGGPDRSLSMSKRSITFCGFNGHPSFQRPLGESVTSKTSDDGEVSLRWGLPEKHSRDLRQEKQDGPSAPT